MSWCHWCTNPSHGTPLNRNTVGTSQLRSTRWRSWLGQSATRRKVAGSIPDAIVGIFHWYNPFGCTMALGLTPSLTEMSTRNISWGIMADNLTTFVCRLSWNLGASTPWNPQGLSRLVMGLALPFTSNLYTTECPQILVTTLQNPVAGLWTHGISAAHFAVNTLVRRRVNPATSCFGLEVPNLIRNGQFLFSKPCVREREKNYRLIYTSP